MTHGEATVYGHSFEALETLREARKNECCARCGLLHTELTGLETLMTGEHHYPRRENFSRRGARPSG